ncbi:ArsR/SmtB family transcription factor [Haloarchaeobius sp. DFWS5]|uniref:ArsR/SmtB family transcription factor n=1 Tax=Haloarchaeobius sp. DFWS5 TaxID=3446114 RepID=UPI003EBD9FA9
MVEQRGAFDGAAERVEDVLRPLANDVRLRIVQALVQSPGKTLTYSELHRASGVADSGQFSYHLRQLQDRFVKQTDDGYRLRLPAVTLYQALLAGTALGENESRTIATESPCPSCDGLLEARYAEDMLSIVCPDCDHHVHHVPFLPGSAEGKSDEALLRTFDQQLRSTIALAVSEVCPYCGGSMSHDFLDSAELGRESDDVAGDDGDDETEGHDETEADENTWKREKLCDNVVRYECDRCHGQLRTSVGETLLQSPAVVAFYHDHGLDASRVPTWELSFVVDTDAVETRAADPWEFVVTARVGDEVLAVVVDDSLSVVETVREVR